MNLTLYGYGALALICAGLYAWATIESQSVETAKANLKAKQAELDAAHADLAEAVKVNTDNDIQIRILKEDLKTQSDLAVKYDALARSRADKLNAALKGISDAPETDDGPVFNVLERFLDGMRERYTQANGAGQNPDRAPDSPSQ